MYRFLNALAFILVLMGLIWLSFLESQAQDIRLRMFNHFMPVLLIAVGGMIIIFVKKKS